MAKLSEMSTEQAAIAISGVIAPLERIAKSECAQGFIKKYGNMPVTKALAVVGITEVLPALLKDQRDDLFAIIGALTGKTLAKIRKQTLAATITDIKESFDPELLQLFGLSSNTAAVKSSVSSQTEESPSAATE